MTAVLLARRAEADVERIDEWWRTNRPQAPALFTEELASAVILLETAPEIGPQYRVKPGVRRLLLRATRYHLYYAYDSATDVVTVLAVWAAIRGRGPKLR